MSHVRTQIRDAIKLALEAGLPREEYRVFASRKYMRNMIRGVAIVDMRFLNINVEQETMGDERLHTGSLYIRVQRDEREEDMDDALDADEVRVTEIVENMDFGDLLQEEPELVQVNFAQDAEAGTAVGAIILRYDLEYRINKSNPESPVR